MSALGQLVLIATSRPLSPKTTGWAEKIAYVRSGSKGEAQSAHVGDDTSA
jgi:hypothetical protein